MNTRVIVIVASVVVVGLIVGGVVMMRSKAASPKASDTPSASPAAQGSGKLEITDEVVGTGAEATAGKMVTVNYVGTLKDGTKFDSSYDRNRPFEFQLGAGQVIQGWDQGVAGMKVGGKRKLVIPSDLAYGNRALPGIPAGSDLVFEVELQGVK